MTAADFRACTSALIIYDSATDQIQYDTDGIGGGAKVQIAKVSAGRVLDHTDFIIL